MSMSLSHVPMNMLITSPVKRRSRRAAAPAIHAAPAAPVSPRASDRETLAGGACLRPRVTETARPRVPGRGSRVTGDRVAQSHRVRPAACLSRCTSSPAPHSSVRGGSRSGTEAARRVAAGYPSSVVAAAQVAAEQRKRRGPPRGVLMPKGRAARLTRRCGPRH